MFFLRTLPFFFLGVAGVSAQTPPSHLPDVEPGYFNASASILINAPIEKVWQILLDFPAYPEWNPFARQQVIYDKWFLKPLEDQTAREGLNMIITSQIPPLEGPVNADTPNNLLNTRYSGENITHVNTPEPYQVAWKFHPSPDFALSAERWSALSVFEGQTFYESREVFGGLLAPAVEVTQADGLRKGFLAQAKALKDRAEGLP
ncbi:hypothetical protein VNI00_008574 [Paramarasmius palmivorus]|uniref:Coenzyme Q-binding protein COQ10 START domain-containing protein n=1 Tax=Paramarasmius palmivorus TaxID=297713 RepID=A0AAW0CX18_9AGAR